MISSSLTPSPQLICNIKLYQDFNWLNFEMSTERQQRLFRLGAERALKFLEKFDWPFYKDTRRDLLQVNA
ncbi:MAG: hypothetical protein U5L96_11415 [Owenweeksia sp.]|nr:hypothetical protein [Owenweeksia sp.]